MLVPVDGKDGDDGDDGEVLLKEELPCQLTACHWARKRTTGRSEDDHKMRRKLHEEVM